MVGFPLAKKLGRLLRLLNGTVVAQLGWGFSERDVVPPTLVMCIKNCCYDNMPLSFFHVPATS